ncbi:MAG: hypothetical protein WA510_26900 [Acidobacteriaceae bacterium]
MRSLARLFAMLIAGLMTVASVAPVARAQHLSFAASVNVPFAFETASGQHFQPGVYTIRVTGMDTMLIRGNDSSGLAMIQEQANEGFPASDGKAIFTRYGDKYFLRSVSLPGSSTRLIFGRSKKERETQIAAAGKSPSAIGLALLQAAR